MSADKPSSKLAEKILNRLVLEKLISEKEAKKVLNNLVEGKMRAEDWSLILEPEDQRKKTL